MLLVLLVFKLSLDLLSERYSGICNWLWVILIRVVFLFHAALGLLLWGCIRELSDGFWLLLLLLQLLSLLRLLSPDL
jgi:hypothetical protein